MKAILNSEKSYCIQCGRGNVAIMFGTEVLCLHCLSNALVDENKKPFIPRYGFPCTPFVKESHQRTFQASIYTPVINDRRTRTVIPPAEWERRKGTPVNNVRLPQNSDSEELSDGRNWICKCW